MSHHHHRLWTIAAVGALLLTGPAARADLFKDADLHLSITYPHGWTERRGTNDTPGAKTIVSFYAPKQAGKGGSENVNLAAQSVPPGGDATLLAQLVSAEEDNMKQAVGAAFEASHTTTVGGLPAISHVYTATIGGQQVKAEQWYVLSQDHLYLFTFTATPQSFAKYQKQAEKIATSLSVAGSTTAPAK